MLTAPRGKSGPKHLEEVVVSPGCWEPRGESQPFLLLSSQARANLSPSSLILNLAPRPPRLLQLFAQPRAGQRLSAKHHSFPAQSLPASRYRSARPSWPVLAANLSILLPQPSPPSSRLAPACSGAARLFPEPSFASLHQCSPLQAVQFARHRSSGEEEKPARRFPDKTSSVFFPKLLRGPSPTRPGACADATASLTSAILAASSCFCLSLAQVPALLPL